jgi:hypothetical protein
MNTTSRQSSQRSAQTAAAFMQGLSLLTSQELAELIDTPEEVDASAEVAKCGDCDPEYNE